MALQLYAHPFSAYCWKVLIALYENETPFEYKRLDDAAVAEEWTSLWPFRKMPILVDHGMVIPEASVIIEHLQIRHPGPRPMLPSSATEALTVRLLDRLSDNYIMTPMQRIVADRIRPEGGRDATGVAEARVMLDTSYAWWDAHMQDREWASDSFGLADCASAPALFYADWVHPIPETFPALRAYRARLLGHPSVARAIDEARPFRALFPLGDPGRD